MAWRGPWLAVLVAASALAGCAAPQPPGSRADLQVPMREIALLGGDVKPFVSPHVWTKLMAKKEGGTKP